MEESTVIEAMSFHKEWGASSATREPGGNRLYELDMHMLGHSLDGSASCGMVRATAAPKLLAPRSGRVAAIYPGSSGGGGGGAGLDRSHCEHGLPGHRRPWLHHTPALRRRSPYRLIWPVALPPALTLSPPEWRGLHGSWFYRSRYGDGPPLAANGTHQKLLSLLYIERHSIPLTLHSRVKVRSKEVVVSANFPPYA